MLPLIKVVQMQVHNTKSRSNQQMQLRPKMVAKVNVLKICKGPEMFLRGRLTFVATAATGNLSATKFLSFCLKGENENQMREGGNMATTTRCKGVGGGGCG